MKQTASLLSVIGMITGAVGLILSFGKDSLLAAIFAGSLVLSVITLMMNFTNSDVDEGKQ